MASTKAEMRDMAGEELGVKRLHQPMQSQDAARITKSFDQVYAQLKKDGLAIWASTGSAPDEVVPHIVFLIAEGCLGVYGVSNERYNRIVMGANKARREIPKMVKPDYESQDNATDY